MRKKILRRVWKQAHSIERSLEGHGFVVALKILLCAAVLMGLTLWGAIRRPHGEIIHTDTRWPSNTKVASAGRFRIAAFNMHRGGKEIGKENLSLTAETIQGFDLVGLNEVRGPSVRRWRNQAEHLGDKLGMAALFGPSEQRWYIASFGNGLLSRFPIGSWRSEPMRARGKSSYRAVITAKIAYLDTIMTVIVVHVERGAMRDDQLSEVYERFAKAEAPAVLLGDFNARPMHPDLKRISSLPGVAHALAANADFFRNIDHIFVKGLGVLKGGYLPNDASDHPLVWSELEYRSHSRPVFR